jgi:RimJ/RimL family protein N-acetyltransferase
MYFKKIVGVKCYLSPINIDDVEKYTEWLNDLEVTVNLQTYSSSLTINHEKELLTEIEKTHNYSIIDKEKDELIGILGFFDIDSLNQTAEVGITIGNKNYWNKGYGSEALTLLLDYGFKALNLNNVLIRVYAFNERAQKCYEKVGFKCFGQRRKSLYRNRERYDVIYLDILPEDFYKENKKKK